MVNAGSSALLTSARAEAAVRMVLPMITEAMKTPQVGDSGFFYLVVMDPAARPGDCAFEQAILFEHAIGDPEYWDADYRAFARAKTRLAWENQMDSHAVQALRPWTLAAGHTTLWGSVALDGIVVGASGLQPWADEAFAGAVAMCLRGLVKAAADEARAKGVLFL